MEDRNRRTASESETSHEKHVEAGRKGAEARWGKSSEGSSSTRGENESSHEKHVEAGRKGAEARWGKE